MTKEESSVENDLSHERPINIKSKRLSMQTLKDYVPDSPCPGDQRQRRASSRLHEKVSAYAMDVQRRISVRELNHVVIEEEEPGIAGCHAVIEEEGLRTAETDGSELENVGKYDAPFDNGQSLEERYLPDDKVSTNEIYALIEDRTEQRKQELIAKFISALTLHGYAQFHEAKGIRKVLWALILAAMAIFIVRLTYLSYRSENFYKQVIEFETEKVSEIGFPTITICSFLPAYTESIYKRFPINVTKEEFKQLYYKVFSNRMTTATSEPPSEREQMWLQELDKKGYHSYKDILELFEKHEERDINSIFVQKIMNRNKCMYENKPCDFNKLFRTVYRHSSQSLCQQFNFYEAEKAGLISRGNGRENGLLMFWDISGTKFFNDDGLNGLLIEIHPYGTPHHLVDHRRSLYLEPGVSTNIDIEEVKTTMLPYPFKPNCAEKEPEIAKDYPYSKACCELECFLKEALEDCSCVPDQFAEYTRDIRTCNITEMGCVFKASLETHCDTCPNKCVSVDYKVFTSRLGIGSNWVHETIRRTPGWETKSREQISSYINHNIIGFRIGFKNLEEQIQAYKEATPWYERISMLGGMMGLFLGFSVITGFEFIFFLFDYLYITIKNRCTQGYLSAVLQQENIKTASQVRSWRQQKK